MQITLSSTASSAAGNAPQSQTSPAKEGGFSSLLLGSVQQTSQNAAVVNQLNQNSENDLSSFLAALLKPAGESSARDTFVDGETALDTLSTFVNGKPELVNMGEELIEKGEMPSLQELAVLLQTDVETLQQSLHSLLHLINGSEKIESGVPEEVQALPADELAALIGQVTETPLPLLKEADKLLVVTTVRAAQLINYFAEHLKQPDQRFQPLQTALKNAAALLNQQASNNSSPYTIQNGIQVISSPQTSIVQSSLQTAFAHYNYTQEAEGISVNKETSINQTASLKPAVQLADSGNPFLHQLSKTEQFMMSVKTNPGPMNMEQFIEKFTQVLNSSNIMKMSNGTKILIKLYPEQLGSLRIELLQQNGVMTAKILSSTQAVKELLEQNAHQLKHAFSQQSVTVDKIDIVSPETKQQLFDRGTQQQRQQEQKQPDRESSDSNDKSQSPSFEETLQNVELEV